MPTLIKNEPLHCGKTFFSLVLIILFGVFIFPSIISAGQNTFPFSPGEKLIIHIKWGLINAGEAVFEVLPVEVINGTESYHFAMTVKTTPFVDFFYKVRDRIDSYTDLKLTRSILYKKQKRGRTKKDVIVHFDWEKEEAQYDKEGKKRKPISIMPCSYDPLSLFYALRIREFKENAILEASVTDGKKCVAGKALIVKREVITVAGKTYDTFLIEPDLEHLEGVFEKSKAAKLKIWVTADNLRLPIRVKSKVIVGSFVGELVSATGTIESEN